MARSQFQQRADDLSAARSRGEIDDDGWFSGMAAIFDAAYPAADNPRAQSGFGGDEERWQTARRPIADMIDRDGTFLDIGCANGYLMECVVRWTRHRVEPYGLELAGAVAELARQQRPRDLLQRLLGEVVAPGGRLIVCGYGSPRSGQPPHPVRRLVRSYGLEAEVEFDTEAPEGGGAILEVAVVRAT